ncbi:MAG TPA: hypothetical protein VNI61_04730 [Gemmatimonadales bacterium]|nr:hypothetical protein [Gemmatimonadales bacterium]
MIRRVLVLGVALGVLGGLSCKDSTGPVAGTLKVKLTMPGANSGLDGAILFTLTGPTAPGAASAGGPGLRVFHQALAPTMKVAVTGTLASGAVVMTFAVDDVRQRYTATLEQVAATAGYQLRSSLNGYSLSVTR